MESVCMYIYKSLLNKSLQFISIEFSVNITNQLKKELSLIS